MFREHIAQLRQSGDHEQADTLELVTTDEAERIEAKAGLPAAKRFMAAVQGKPTLRDYLNEWNSDAAKET